MPKPRRVYAQQDLIEQVSDKVVDDEPMQAIVLIAAAYDLNCDDVAQAVLHGTA
jgi:hypothetical protein